MSSLSSLYRQLRQYRTFLDDVNDCINVLNRTIDSAESAIKIGEYYTIDEATADNNVIKNSRNELSDKKQFLISTILPAISRKIREIEDEIARLEAEDDD